MVQLPANVALSYNDRFCGHVVDADLGRNVVVVGVLGVELQFYDNRMEIINTLTI
jgi:hypothetical protein